jgi:hypothetical protein
LLFCYVRAGVRDLATYFPPWTRSSRWLQISRQSVEMPFIPARIDRCRECDSEKIAFPKSRTRNGKTRIARIKECKLKQGVSGFGYLVFSFPAPSQSFAQLVYLLLKSWFLSHSLLKFLANRLSRQRATFSVAKGRRLRRVFILAVPRHG